MSTHKRRFLALKTVVYCAFGVALAGICFYFVFANVTSLIYRIVMVFLTLIFLSNFVAKVIVSYFHQRKSTW